MKALIEQFLQHAFLERGLSENTREAYARDLTCFVTFLQARNIRSINAVTRRDITDFLMHEKERGLGTNTIARRLVAIRVFFAYLQQEGLLDSNIVEAMDSPRLWRVLPDVLSPRDVERLLNLPFGNEKRGLRDRALLEMLYATGLRVSELAELTLEDIHLDSGYLRSLGKGNKVRVVPFGSSARRALEQYLSEARPAFLKDSPDRHVFLTYRGKPFTRKGLWRLIKDAAKRAGITRPVSPHTLRHSFASHLLANGAPLRIIQEMLGHADIATTQVYTHVDAGRLRAVHSQFHPRG